MTTRLSKIARLPATIREQLNRRLHNGELGRTILPWVNNLPKTKKVLTELFNGKPITHQNLSEWRSSGYQDWLFHQDRLHWFSRLEEEDKEISKHDGCADTYEAMSRFFIFEIGQAMQAAQKIKNPETRWAKIEPLAEKFARLQNSYNWSRRVQLEFDKYNNQFEPDETDSPEPETDDAIEEQNENLPQPVARIEPLNRNDAHDSVSLASPKGGLELLGKQRKESAGGGGPLRAERAGASESLGRGEEAFRVHGENKPEEDQNLILENQPNQTERQRADALQDAPRFQSGSPTRQRLGLR